jgi:succinate dehydrogenase / fumarate reductase, flavoprotein subunit
MALALRAGLPLEDMEFFQIHPTGLLNGILITEGARGEGAYLMNVNGERFMERYAPQFMELAPRDVVSRAVQQEINEGRAFPDGGVRLDVRHLGAEKIKSRLPQIREIAMHFAGVDPIEEPIPVRPTVHYTMGGIEVNTDCASRMKGVYAAGEASCLSVHGANRLGGNSLLETVVFGSRVAKSIPDFLSAQGGSRPKEDALLADAMKRFERLFGDETQEDAPKLRREMERGMVADFGVFRSQATMQAGLEQMAALSERYRKVRVRERGLVFNTELIRALELGFMLDIARCCALGAVNRKESRGGHYRLDFPTRDDENFLKHSLIRMGDDGALQLSYKPVTIVDIEPTERKY